MDARLRWAGVHNYSLNDLTWLEHEQKQTNKYVLINKTLNQM